jgi:hypothetical protein
MNKTDKKLIDANPGKTPYELLQLGLTQMGFEELEIIQGRQKEIAASHVQPSKVEETIQHTKSITPQLSAPPHITGRDSVILLNMKKGIQKRMSRFHAEKIQRKYPTEFKIL